MFNTNIDKMCMEIGFWKACQGRTLSVGIPVLLSAPWTNKKQWLYCLRTVYQQEGKTISGIFDHQNELGHNYKLDTEVLFYRSIPSKLTLNFWWECIVIVSKLCILNT